MADFGDDFGDLYADVEAQASSVINGVPGFPPFLSEPKECIANARGHRNPSSGDDDGFGSESEDDLNIVLNDEDCKNKSFAYEGRESVKTDENCEQNDEDDFAAIDEFKCVSAHGSSNPSSMKANLGNAMLATSGWNHNNVHDHRKGSISDQGALASATRNFRACQRKYGFTLPRFRSILDVNIDAFEEKPWNQPGVDMTDFFNFGFNEDSWKQYCNSVDNFRLSESMRLGNLNHVSENRVFEDGSKHAEKVDETMADDICQPKGRAIQVEDSIRERQPTVNAWRPRDRDSDVVIHINLDDASDMGEKLDNTDGTFGYAPIDGELDSIDERRDFHQCNNRSEDEFYGQCLKDIGKRMERCSARSNASNPITVDPTDTEENQSHNIEDNNYKKSLASDGIIAWESDVMNACSPSKSKVDIELSCEEDGQLSLASSCFESDFEASEDSSHPDPAKISSPMRRSSRISGANLCQYGASHRKNLRNFAKIKPVDCRDYSKCKSPMHFEGNPRMNVDYCGLNAENVFDRDCLSISYGRRKEKLQDVSYKDREDLACHEKSELSTGFGGREFARNHSYRGFESYRKGSFHEEREYEREEGFWHRSGSSHRDVKHVAYEDTYPRSSGKNNKFESRYSTNYGRQFLDHELADVGFTQESYARSISLIEQRRYTLDECYDRRFRKFGNGLPRRKSYNDDSHLELEGSWSGKVEDKYWGNVDVPYLSHHQSDRIEDEYWDNTDAHHSSHQFYRESDGGRWTGQISPKNGVSRSRSVKRYRRQYPGEDEESGWFDDYNYKDQYSFEDRFIHPDDRDHYRRKRRSGTKSEVLPLTEEPIVRHQHAKLHAERSSFNSRSNQRHRRDYSSRESLHDVMHINYMHSNQYGNRTMRNGSNSRSIRTNKLSGVENEQQFPECRDSVDLYIGDGKLSVRCRKDQNSRFNSRVKDPDEQITCKDLDESTRYEAVQSNRPKVYCNGENEKSHKRFQVLVQDDDLEIEDGQILVEELSTRPMENAHNVSKRMLHDDSALCGSKAGGAASNDSRIHEMLARMEKRRERFKVPIITLKMEEDSCSMPDNVTVSVDLPHAKQHRPARKRQWCVR